MDVAALIEQLDLVPHPEGGFYRETFRSEAALDLSRGVRAASTAIWFLLPRGTFSAWHRVRSDEVWHLYLGGPVELHQLADDHRLERLGTDLASGERPQRVVPANTLQAAFAREDALCGCTVAPGFDFADFDLPTRDHLLASHPGFGAIIRRFTRD